MHQSLNSVANQPEDPGFKTTKSPPLSAIRNTKLCVGIKLTNPKAQFVSDGKGKEFQVSKQDH